MATTITNTSNGPRGVTVESGDVVFLDPGQSADLDISDGELKSARSTGYFEFGARAKKAAEKAADETKAPE